MCNTECLEKFNKMELDMNTIATDIKWMKGMCAICVVIFGATAGVDLGGVV